MNPPYLRPFVSYKGSKWRAAARYPRPEHTTIVEPFAGGAGYSSYHYRHRVILLDSYVKVARIWSYLRRVSQRTILDLPEALEPGVNINESHGHLRQVERDLIGFWNDRGQPEPTYTPCNWTQVYPDYFFWPKARLRIARQIGHIKHWSTYHADYRSIANVTNSTLFLDPPYQQHGSMYPESNMKLDFDELRELVLQLHWSNQVIVCEGEGADWLPFEFFSKGTRSVHKSNGRGPDELIWYRASRDRKPAIGCGFDLTHTARWLTTVLSPRENAA